MSDDERLSDPVSAAEMLNPGDGLVLRHRNRSEKRRLALELRPLCQRRKVFLIISADGRLAMEVGANGIHLAEASVCRAAKTIRWARQCNMIVTAAAHSEAAVRRATAARVDGILISPVCATPSHPDQPALGVLRFARMVRSTALGVYGLGGIDQTNLLRLRHTGMVGVAGIDGIVNSP